METYPEPEKLNKFLHHVHFQMEELKTVRKWFQYRTLTHHGFLWDTSEGTIALSEDKTTQVETWAKKLLAARSSTHGNL